MTYARIFLLATLLLLFASAAPAAYDSATAATGELQVARVVPEGNDVPAGRQIVVTFDRPMVAIGDMAVDAGQSPVHIEPAPHCHWHWLDPRSLACELDENDALLPARDYQLSVVAGIRAQDGSVLAATRTFHFTTERPKIASYAFHTWLSPATPTIFLVFNQAVTKDSVERSLRFSGNVPVRAEPAPRRFYDDRIYLVLPLPGESYALVVPGAALSAAGAGAQRVPALLDDSGAPVEARRAWIVTPVRELGFDAHTSLKVMPGLRGYAGDLLGKEDRTVVEFDTFGDFRFLGIRCRAPVTEKRMPPEAPLDTSQERCDPLASVAMVFSAPVIAEELKAHIKLEPDLAGERSDYKPWDNLLASSRLAEPHTRGQDYEITLPEHLRAFHDYSLSGLDGVRDEFGRILQGSTGMRFRTDHRPARLRTGHAVSILEQEAPSAVALYVTNLTGLSYHYRRYNLQGFANNLDAQQPVNRVWDVAYAVPGLFRELLGGRSGIVQGKVTPHPTPPMLDSGAYFDDGEEPSDPATPEGRSERDFTVEVTPFQLHYKFGHFNSLAWVTRLATGLPVAGARVSVYRDSGWSPDAPELAQAYTDEHGVAMLPGREALAAKNWDASVEPPMSLRVQAGTEMAWLPLDNDFLIDTYRASHGTVATAAMRAGGHTRSWGTTAQGVYRLGDTIQFKLYLRAQDNFTLTAPAVRAGYTVSVLDPTGKAVYEKADVQLSEFGGYAGEFVVPATGAVGWYQFILARGEVAPEATDTPHRSGGGAIGDGSWEPMRVLVADFTPAPFQVQNSLNATLYEPDDPFEVATQASLHAGGPYANAQTRVTARLRRTRIVARAPEAAEFEFSSVAVSQCRGHSASMDWETIHEEEAMVDDRGTLKTAFATPNTDITYGRIEVESAVRDERGKYVANRSPADYRARDRYVGLRSTQWVLEEGKPGSVQYAVIDKDGMLVAGTPVSITIQGEVTVAARVKGAGNAYLTSYRSHWEERARCQGTSATAPQTCSFTPGAPGLYSIIATVSDTHGREHSSEICSWVVGKGRVLWQEPDDMSLSLVPEKESYQIGEHMRVLVRNPFPGAQALVTIERYGVIKRWVQTLEGNTPVLDIPVERDFLPGFYLSVLAMSPRVAPVPGSSPQDPDGVDLGRPTYRIGYLQTTVTDPYKILDVKIQSDRDTYKPREIVKLHLQAQARHEDPRQPVEFAVAVLDEAVFDLIQDGVGYFDPYKGFYKLDPLDLLNFGLLSRLVGLQKFEKKGSTPGGDGGAGFDMRSVSKYVAYWNPSVRADAQGKAALEFALPDNLTGWRVFAVAVTPGDRLGLGDFKFKSSKPTELRPVMPNQLTEGDSVSAGFSVLNRSDRTRDISVHISATGPVDDATRSVDTMLHLGPFKRETVFLPLHSTGAGPIHLEARAGDDADRDSLAHTIWVQKRGSLDVGASYGTTVSDHVSEVVQFPANMMPGLGALSVTLSPSVIGNLDGAFRYLRDYPYPCWEQRLSRALMASNYLRLKSYLPADLEWNEAGDLPQKTLDEAASFQAPNGGMGFFAPQDDRVSPYLSAATALAFGELRAAGYRVPEAVENHLLDYLDRLLHANTAPTFYSEGMVSSVRAVALQALAQRERLNLADLERYRENASGMDLFGLAAYLQAALRVKDAQDLAADLARRILAHADQSGGKIQFMETRDDGYLQMLATPARSQCAVLQALLNYGQTPAGALLVGDVPFKLVRSTSAARGSHDHWENTQENLYCANALAQYAGYYEANAPALTAHVRLGGQRLGAAHFDTLRAPQVVLSRNNDPADVGRLATVQIDREGQGRLYYATRLSFSRTEASAKAVNAGIELHREYSVERAGVWMLLQSPMHVRWGELVRVDLYVSLPAARDFVVIDDPVPGGLEPVNRELATASGVDADKAAFQAAGGSFWFHYGDWSEYGISLWSFYHTELRHDAARFYADHLPAGNYHLSYAAQAMAAGNFGVAPLLGQEMYDPDIYGKSLPGRLIVEQE